MKFEVHVGEKTGLGNIGDPRSSVLAELRREIATQRKMDVEDVTVRKGTIKEEFLRAAKEQVEAKLKLKEEVQTLARAGGSTTTELGVRRAEAALTAQGKVPGLAERPFQVTKSPNTFLDAKNHPVTVFTPERGANSVKLAGEVVKTLRAANAAGGNPARMIVDVSLLSADGQRTLRRNLQMLANQAPKLNLQNVVIVDSSRGITARFTALPK